MTETRDAPNRILSSVGIRPGEVRLAAWMTALFMVTQASHGVGANAADTMFFLRYGVEDLPLMILLSGPAVMLTIVGHSAGLAWRGAQHWLVTAMGLASVWVVLLRVGILLGSDTVYPVIWISTQALVYLTLTVIWNAAGSGCTTRQAKRLFPVFATAAVAGGVVGNLVVGPLTSSFGAENLLVVEGALLVAATLLVRRASLFFRSESEEGESVRVEMARAFSSIRSSPLLKLAAVVLFLLFALFFLVVFPFSEIVTSTFPAETEMAGFLGLFSSVATAATFLFSLLVTGRLFSRLGLIVTLLIVPAVYLLGFSVWLLAFGIITAAMFRGLQWVAVNSVQTTAYSALFNVLSSRRRGPVLALMTAVPAQLGTMAAGAILLFGADLSRTALFVVGVVMSAAGVGIVAAMRPAYLSAVVEAVRRGLVSVWESPHAGVVASPVDRDVVTILQGHLSDPRPRARAIAAAGLGSMRDGSALSGVESLLDDDDPLVRSAAFQAVCQIEPTALEPRLVVALSDESAEVRLNAIRYLDSSGESELPVSILASVLDDPDPRVRAAAAWMVPLDSGLSVAARMVSSGDPHAVRAILDEIARHPGNALGLRPVDFIDDDDPAVRAAAVAAVVASGTGLDAVLPNLDDRSVRVRRAAADALAGSDEGRALLVGVLEVGSVIATEAALDALTPVESLDPRFTNWAMAEAHRAAYLAAHRRVLAADLQSPDGRYLVRVLDSRVGRLIDWVLMAMTTSATREIMPLVARGVHSDDPETNAQAVEALESVGDRSVLSVLLPLLEQSGYNAPDDGYRSSLEGLADDFDPWLSTLAARSLRQLGADEGDDVARLGTMAADRLDTLDEMGRILVLQQVPMFSGLDPEDLILVARFTQEVHFDPNDPIYREGDPGTELLVIVEGSAVVTRTREGATHVIATYGPGEHVGELALLTGGRRFADVAAGGDGLHGLSVGKSELIAILEERPEVAIGMLGTLAARLIEQT